MAYMDSYYRSLEDLLSRRFNATDEQIKTIIEKNREIKTNYVKIDIAITSKIPSSQTNAPAQTGSRISPLLLFLHPTSLTG